MKRIFTSILLIASAISASAQTPVVLTLNRTIEIAADSSLQAFIAQNMYQSSYWEYHSFKAARLPSLMLEMTPIQYYRDFTRRYDSEQNIDIYRRQQSLYSYGGLTVTQNLDITGGTFFVNSNLAYMQNIGDNKYTQYTSVPIRIGYQQKLFGFNAFKWERRIEPLKFDKSQKQFLYDRENISEQAAQVFFDLAMAQTEYGMAVENVASGDTLYAIGEERFQIMSISQADLMTLKLDAINARNTLRNAEINLKRAMFAFVSFLNMEKDTPVRLDLPNTPSGVDIPLEMALEQARANNPSFLDNRRQILEAEKNVDQTQKSAVFDASFYASIGFNQVAENFGDAYRRPLQEDVVSIGLSIPLIDWGVRKGKANMAKNNLNVTRISVQQQETSLEQDVIMTVNDFNIQQGLIRSAEEAMQLANMAYNSTKERFIIGKADINSLTLSLNRQKEAQKNYISALQNYWLSYYKIRKLTLYDFERKEKIAVDFNRKYGL
ncbi:MAG: TolC family protein [Tannerella sp.]|jgi:outer membrane protein TolC|nr:TolC family protein [Tannerella sp.]